MSFLVSAFADEISPDLATQIAVLKKHGVHGLDLRSVGDVNVLKLSDDMLREVRERCAEAGTVVQAVGSPINKVALADAEAEIAKLERAIEVARLTGATRIRLFTPIADDWPKVEDLMARMVDMAEEAGMVLLHENDAEFFGAFPENAKLLFDRFGGPHFKAAFDFSNTVLIGFRPFDDWFPWLLPHLDTLHIKDAKDGKVKPAGEGDGQMVETLRWLIGEGWNGALTLEPHLQAAGPFGGFSGEELFGVAVGALRKVLGEAGGLWRTSGLE